MENTLEKALQGIGFNKKQAKIYLACLELGIAKPSAIGDKAQLNRVTAYEILKRLKEKEVVIEIIKNKVKYYSAVNPEIIIAKNQAKLNIAQKTLPELLSLYNLNLKKPRILYFEGIQGIKKIYEDTLLSQTEILNFANVENVYRVLPDFDDHYVSKRVKKGIKVRVIAPRDKQGIRTQEEGAFALRKIRLVPPHLYAFTNEILIYSDKVAIISLLEKIGVIIESADIAKTQREIFKMAWEYAGQFDKYSYN